MRVVLWLVLVAFFVFFFQYFAVDEVDTASRFFPVLILIFGLALLFGLILPGKRWQRLNNQGISYLSAGDADRAAECFELKWYLLPQQRAVTAFNLGLTRLTQGRIDDAYGVLRRADAGGHLRAHVFAHNTIPELMAICEGLRGDLTAAKRHLEELERRRGTLPESTGIPAEMVVLCREGHPAAALKLFESRAREVDQLSGITRKIAFLCRAFAIAEEGGDPLRVREAIGGAWPLDPGRYDFLGAQWPQMRDFLAAQQLSRAA